MSLRFRLVILVAAVLLVVLALSAMLLYGRATNSVRIEMEAALAGAGGSVHEALAQSGERPKPAFLSAVVRSFNGQRHVRATLYSSPNELIAASRLASPVDAAPTWFARLIGEKSRYIRFPLPRTTNSAVDLVLVLRTDPANEIAEVWGQAVDAFAVMLLFCAGICIAIYAVLGHSLRLLSKFNDALRDIANGRYETDLPEEGPSEIVSMGQAFNRMAERLRGYQSQNVALREQILNLQEEERAEVARDLHDEVGPYLFAINVDADAIPKLAAAMRFAEISERAHAIREAVAHVQKHVKAILRQLRLAPTLDFGLKAAIDDLVAFWSPRNPAIRFSVRVDVDGMTVEPPVEDAAYRIVQESISNAIRHGQPATIAISVEPSPDGGLSITVTDDGIGLRSKATPTGLGLVGMTERARALHGTFDIANRAEGRGVTVRALLPSSAQHARKAELAD